MPKAAEVTGERPLALGICAQRRGVRGPDVWVRNSGASGRRLGVGTTSQARRRLSGSCRPLLFLAGNDPSATFRADHGMQAKPL
jgi:hypothetical protein